MPIWIATLLSGHHVSNVQFTGWLEEEHQYLKSKQAEPQAEILGVEYVELLTKYNDAQWAFDFVVSDLNELSQQIVDSGRPPKS